MRHERAVRAMEDEVHAFLLRSGADRELRVRVQAIAPRELGRLERREQQAMKRLDFLLERVL